MGGGGEKEGERGRSKKREGEADGKGGSLKAGENGEESYNIRKLNFTDKTHLPKHNKEAILSFDCQKWLLQGVQHTLERMEKRTTVPNSDTGTVQE